jgi:hypothetical protein
MTFFGGSVGGAVVLLAWLVALFLGTRVFFARWLRRRRGRLSRLVDELAAIAAQSSATTETRNRIVAVAPADEPDAAAERDAEAEAELVLQSRAPRRS